MHIPSECCPYDNVAVCLCNQDYFYITHLIFFSFFLLLASSNTVLTV